MFTDIPNIQPAPFYTVDGDMNFLNYLRGTENIDIEPSPFRNFFLYSFEQDQESIDQINSFNSLDFISSLIDHDPFPHSNEVYHIVNCVPSDSNNHSNFFPFSEFNNLLNNSESNSILVEEENLLGKKRQKRQKPRKEEKDEILVKIMRAFFNRYIFNKLNSELISIGSKQYFEKFPQKIHH